METVMSRPTEVLTPTATASSVLQVQAGVLNRIAALWTLVKNRRAVSELLSLDDHMLHDIGVSRGDVSEVLAAPGDASGHLAARVLRQRVEERARLRDRLRLVHRLSEKSAQVNEAGTVSGSRAA
jgi:uncharacterized protein YjiS (DUF1127 family)